MKIDVKIIEEKKIDIDFSTQKNIVLMFFKNHFDLDVNTMQLKVIDGEETLMKGISYTTPNYKWSESVEFSKDKELISMFKVLLKIKNLNKNTID